MQENNLESIRLDFEQVRDELEPQKLQPLLRGLLDLPASEKERRGEFFEILEDVMYAIFESFGSGTVSESQRERIFEMLKDNLKPNQENGARSSLQTLAGLLIPHPGVKDWLSGLAREERNPDRKRSLLEYAKTNRDGFVI